MEQSHPVSHAPRGGKGLPCLSLSHKAARPLLWEGVDLLPADTSFLLLAFHLPRDSPLCVVHFVALLGWRGGSPPPVVVLLALAAFAVDTDLDVPEFDCEFIHFMFRQAHPPLQDFDIHDRVSVDAYGSPELLL